MLCDGPNSVTSNLVKNYSPHLSPNTRSAPSTNELRRILEERASDMLEIFLKKERRRRIALNLDEENEPRVEAEVNGKGKARQEPHSARTVSMSFYLSISRLKLPRPSGCRHCPGEALRPSGENVGSIRPPIVVQLRGLI